MFKVWKLPMFSATKLTTTKILTICYKVSTLWKGNSITNTKPQIEREYNENLPVWLKSVKLCWRITVGKWEQVNAEQSVRYYQGEISDHWPFPCLSDGHSEPTPRSHLHIIRPQREGAAQRQTDLDDVWLWYGRTALHLQEGVCWSWWLYYAPHGSEGLYLIDLVCISVWGEWGWQE